MPIRFLVAAFCLMSQVGCGSDSSQIKQDGRSSSSPARSRTSLAVLPFAGKWDKPGDLIGDDWYKNVEEFVTTTLPNSLSETFLKKADGRFAVLSVDTVRGKLEAAKLAPDAEARRILPDDVKAIVTGKLSSEGKLTVQLIEAESGHLLWGKTYQLALNVNPFQNRVNFGLATTDQDEVVNEVFGRFTGK